MNYIVLESQVSFSFPYCSAMKWISTPGVGVSAQRVLLTCAPQCSERLWKISLLGIGHRKSSVVLRTQHPWAFYEEPLPLPYSLPFTV